MTRVDSKTREDWGWICCKLYQYGLLESPPDAPEPESNLDLEINKEDDMSFLSSFVRRLDVMSLKSAIFYIKNEEIVDREEQDSSIDPRAKLVWLNAKGIINREFPNPKPKSETVKKKKESPIIGLMRLLTSFGTDELDYKMFRPTPNNKKSLSILDACSLIKIQDAKIRVDNYLIVDVIREENKSNGTEVEFLRECYEMLRKAHPKIFYEYFVGIWENILSHSGLTREIEDKHRVSKYFSIFCTESEINIRRRALAKTVARFKEIYGDLNERTISIQYQEMISILKLDKFSNDFSLAKWQEFYDVYKRIEIGKNLAPDSKKLDWTGWFIQIGEIMYRIALKQNPAPNAEAKINFFEESLRAFQMASRSHCQNEMFFVSNLYSNHHFSLLLKCFIKLKKSDKIIEQLKQILMILKLREANRRTLYNGFMAWGIIFEDIREYAHAENENSVGIELSAVLEYLFEFKIDELKTNLQLNNPILPQLAKVYIKCLIQLQDFDKILIVVTELDNLWKEILRVLIQRSSGHEEDDRFMTNQVNLYFDFHQLLLTTLVELKKTSGDYQQEILILDESIEFTKCIVKCIYDKATYESLSVYNLRNPGPSHIIRCYLSMGRMCDLILYMDEHEELLVQKFGFDGYDLANEMVDFLETIVEHDNWSYCIHFYKLIETIELKIEKCWDKLIQLVGGNGNVCLIPVLQEKVQKIIFFCTKHKKMVNSSLDVAMDSSA